MDNKITNSFSDAINPNSESGVDITEKEGEKINQDKDNILLNISNPELKQKFESKLIELDNFFNIEGKQIHKTTQDDLSLLSSILDNNEKIGEEELSELGEYFGINCSELNSSLHESFGITLVPILTEYKRYIESDLKGLSHEITNKIKKSIGIKVGNLTPLIEEQKDDQRNENEDGSLNNLKNRRWILNSKLNDALSPINEKLLPSALFLAKNQNGEINQSSIFEAKNALGTSDAKHYGISKARFNRVKDEIEEMFAEEVSKDGDFDEGFFSTQDILDTNSTLAIYLKIKPVETSFLNEKDKEIEAEATKQFMFAIAAHISLEAGPAAVGSIFPGVGTAIGATIGNILGAGIDIKDTFSNRETLVVILQEAGLVDPSYRMDKGLSDNILAGIGLIPGATTAIKGAQFSKHLSKIPEGELIDGIKKVLSVIEKNSGISSKSEKTAEAILEIPSFSDVLRLAGITEWNKHNPSIGDLLRINKLAENNRAIYEVPEIQRALRQVIATENHPALGVLLDVKIGEVNHIVQTIWANMKPTNEAIGMIKVDEGMDVGKNALRDRGIEPSYVDYKNFTKSGGDIPVSVEEMNTIFKEAFKEVLKSDPELLAKYQEILTQGKTITFEKIVSDIKVNSQFDHFLQMAKSRLEAEKALEGVTDGLHGNYREKFESFMKGGFSKESFTSQPVIIKGREGEKATYMTKKYSISEDGILSIEKAVTGEKAEVEKYQIFITDLETGRKVINDSVLHMVKKGDIPTDFPFAKELKRIMRTGLANSECILPFWNKVDKDGNFVDEKTLDALRKLGKDTNPKLIEELLSIDYKGGTPKKYITDLVTEAIKKGENKIAGFFDVAKMGASNVSGMFNELPTYYNKVDDIMKKMPEGPERTKALDNAYNEYLSKFGKDMTVKMQKCVEFMNKWKEKGVDFNVGGDEVWTFADKTLFAEFQKDFLGFVKDAGISGRFSYAELKDINKTGNVASGEKALDIIEKCSGLSKALEKKVEGIANSLKNKYSGDTYTTFVKHLNKLGDMTIFIENGVRMVKFPHAPFGDDKVVFAINKIIDIKTKNLLPNSILTKYLDETGLGRATEQLQKVVNQ